MHAPPPVEGEQRGVVAGGTSALGGASCSASSSPMRGPCGTSRLLPNLPPRTTSRSRCGSTSAEAQPARLTGAQPQPVAEGEDRRGRSGPAAGLAGCRAARRRRRAADGPAATSKRNGIRAAVPRRRRVCSGEALQQLLGDRPVEQAATTPSRWLKLRGRGRGREARKSSSSAAVSSSSRSTDAVRRSAPAAAARPPRCGTCGPAPACGPGSARPRAQVVGHRSTSSPSPRATSRSASTATLA